jgi:hypothetical protein
MKVITIGKRHFAAEQVAFIEPFDPAANPEFRPEKNFKGRVVLLDRDIVLTEQTPQDFATARELHLFTEDNVAVNRAIQFKIETFEPTQDFKPTKPYQTRLKWRDPKGGGIAFKTSKPGRHILARINAFYAGERDEGSPGFRAGTEAQRSQAPGGARRRGQEARTTRKGRRQSPGGIR